jgi:hypothetical protein
MILVYMIKYTLKVTFIFISVDKIQKPQNLIIWGKYTVRRKQMPHLIYASHHLYKIPDSDTICSLTSIAAFTASCSRL